MVDALWQVIEAFRFEDERDYNDKIWIKLFFACPKNKAPQEASFYFLFRQKCEHGYFIEGG